MYKKQVMEMAYRRNLNRFINNYNKMIKEQTIQKNIDIVDQFNQDIQEKESRIETILKTTELVSFDPQKFYEKLYKQTEVKGYTPLEMETEKQIKKRVGYKKENKILEKIMSSRKEKRIKGNIAFQEEYDRVYAKYQEKEKENRKKYDEYVQEVRKLDHIQNKKVNKRKFDFDRDSTDEIKKVYETIESKLKPNVDSVKSISFDYENRIALLELEFINPDTELSRIKGAKYIKSKWDTKEIQYTNSEFERLYEKLVFNSILSITAKVWFYLIDKIDEFIINGYVYKLNPAVGKQENYYFFSAKLEQGDIPFERIHLLDSKMFLDSKNAKYRTPLTSIKQINKYEFSNKKMINIIDDEIDGFDFEKLTKTLLEKNNYDNITVTKASGDYGADVIAYKDNIKYAIQCKKYSEKVGVKAIQEVIAAKTMYKCHVGVVLTNNYFTPNAEKLAESNGILLWDKNKLEELIEKAELK